MMIRRTPVLLVCLLLSFAFSLQVVSGSSVSVENADPEYLATDVGFSTSTEGKSFSSQFYYNDEMMLSDATVLSTDLAKVSVGLAAAAYKEDVIKSCLSSMEYDLVGGKPFNYDRTPSYEDCDFVGYSIGHKSIAGYDVYIIAVRGTTSNEEWISNFRLGENDEHYGFYTAANEIMKTINNYISGSSNIFLVTGHSRGAAVANIVAAKLSQTQEYASRNHIFGYTFACPAVKVNADHSLSNIRNFNNPGDAIASVPLEDWPDAPYGRFGIDIDLDADSDVFLNMKQRFRSSFSCDYEGLLYTDTFVSTLKTLAATKEDFSTSEHRFMLDCVGWLLGGHNLQTLGDIVNHYSVIGSYCICTKAVWRILLDWSASTLEDSVNIEKQAALAVLEDIDDALADTAQMTKDEFSDWLTHKEALTNKIRDDYDIEITSREDLSEARNEMNAIVNDNTFTTGNLETYKLLYCSSDGSMKPPIWHAHQPETYVLWINSMYYGYEGWKGYDEEIAVSIPDNINHIGHYCFYDCDGLTEISLNSSTTKYDSTIEPNAFYSCKNLEKVTISPEVTLLGQKAFASCTSLTSVTMPISANYNCGTGYSYTDNPSFYGCTNVREIHYTKGNDEVMQYSDNGSSSYSLPYIARESLTTVTLEEGITAIPDRFLDGCSKVEGITLPETIKKIGVYAFNDCKLGPETVIPSGLEAIGEYAFNNCSGLTTIEIPSGITKIPNDCFRYCTGASKITLPEGLTSIAYDAFYGCNSLSEIEIPDSVSSIGERAFCGCTALTSVTMPISANYSCNGSSGGYNSFYGCTNVREIHYTKGNGEVMQYSDNGSSSYSLPYTARENLTTVTLEEGINEIPDYFLNYCSKVSTVYLPVSIETIASFAFNHCAGLSDVYFNGSEMEANGILINNNNTSLNSAKWHYVLENPDADDCLKLPDQLRVIEVEAFTGVSAEVIIIPATVETIKSGAFSGCSNLKAIIFGGSPESIENDIVTNPEDVTVFVIKDSNTEAWAHDSGFRVKYNLGNN